MHEFQRNAAVLWGNDGALAGFSTAAASLEVLDEPLVACANALALFRTPPIWQSAAEWMKEAGLLFKTCTAIGDRTALRVERPCGLPHLAHWAFEHWAEDGQ